MARRLTNDDAMAAWRVDAQLSDGHTVQQTLQFVSELQDIADEQQRKRALPVGLCRPTSSRDG